MIGKHGPVGKQPYLSGFIGCGKTSALYQGTALVVPWFFYISSSIFVAGCSLICASPGL